MPITTLRSSKPSSRWLYIGHSLNSEITSYLGTAAVLYASVLASGSRAGTILSTAEILLVPFLLWMPGRVQGRDLLVRLIPLAILFAVFVMVVSWQPVWARLRAPDPMALRRELDVSSVQMAKAHPWLGTGLGTWPIVYPQYAVIDIGVFANQAHNDWLQWTAEGGLPFSIMLGTLFLWSLRRGFESIWGLGVAAVFSSCEVVDYPFSRAALASWPILILSLVSCEKRLVTLAVRLEAVSLRAVVASAVT